MKKLIETYMVGLLALLILAGTLIMQLLLDHSLVKTIF